VLFVADDELPHAVYIEAGSGADRYALLQRYAGQPVLTIGDAGDFVASGGMLGLVHEGRRIVFEANPQAIQASRLQVSAKALKLARVMGTSP